MKHLKTFNAYINEVLASPSQAILYHFSNPVDKVMKYAKQTIDLFINFNFTDTQIKEFIKETNVSLILNNIKSNSFSNEQKAILKIVENIIGLIDRGDSYDTLLLELQKQFKAIKKDNSNEYAATTIIYFITLLNYYNQFAFNRSVATHARNQLNKAKEIYSKYLTEYYMDAKKKKLIFT